MGQNPGSMLGRDLEALIQSGGDYKKEYGDSYVTTVHLVLSFVKDRWFGKQLFKDFQMNLEALKSSIQTIRGRQNIIGQGMID